MAEKPIGWTTTCNRFVAFLDIMGFRDRVFRESHEDVKKTLESLRPAIEFIENTTKEALIKRITKSQGKNDVVSTPSAVLPITFSDSIILVSWDDSDLSASFLFTYIEMIMNVAIDKGIPMKGALAFGKLTADLDKSLYFGKPLIDAYELQDELRLYGTVLHHTAEKRLIEIGMSKLFEQYFIFKYPVPMKSGKITHYILDWSSYQADNILLNSIFKLYESVSGPPRIYVDNTLEFIQWVIKKKAELKKEKKP